MTRASGRLSHQTFGDRSRRRETVGYIIGNLEIQSCRGRDLPELHNAV
jgi:hypothetical protein